MQLDEHGQAGDRQARGRDGAVVVPLDGSERSMRAVRWAEAFARGHHALLTVVAAWQPSIGQVAPDGLMTAGPEDGRRAAEDEARSVAAALGYVGAQGVGVQGRPHDVLCTGPGHRVLVLGTTGHLGLWGLLTGGLARWCVRRAGCPVVLLGRQAACAPVERVVVPGGLDPAGRCLPWAADVAARLGAALVVVDAGVSAADDDLAQQDRATRLARAEAVAAAGTPVLGRSDGAGWSRALTRLTHPGDLLVLPYRARLVPRYGSITCPVAVLPPGQA